MLSGESSVAFAVSGLPTKGVVLSIRVRYACNCKHNRLPGETGDVVTTEVWRPALTAEFEMDGTRLELIPLESRHREVLADAFGRLSERSRYLRFMAPVPELSPSELTYLTDLDLVDRFAWGLLVEREPAAVGRYVRTTPSDAEVAITVLDDYQGRGLGSLLVQALAVVAADVGFRTFEFEVLAENHAMLALLRRLGASTTADSGVVHAEIAVDAISDPPIDTDELLTVVSTARSVA